MAAALQALKEIRPAKSKEPLAGPGEVLDNPRLLRARWPTGQRFEVIRKTVAGKMERGDGIHDAIRIEPAKLIARVLISYRKRKGFRLPLGKVKAGTALQN